MTENEHVRIERTFDAPIDLIWSMWTEAEHFANWYGPMGATIPKADMDVRVGGHRHIAMEIETPNGAMQMYFVGEYREVEPKTRLVYTEAIADADGNTMPAEHMGMPAGTPTETSIVVELEDLGDRTRMVMTHIGVPADSPGGHGWAMAIDKLDARIIETPRQPVTCAAARSQGVAEGGSPWEVASFEVVQGRRCVARDGRGQSVEVPLPADAGGGDLVGFDSFVAEHEGGRSVRLAEVGAEMPGTCVVDSAHGERARWFAHADVVSRRWDRLGLGVHRDHHEARRRVTRPRPEPSPEPI